MSRRTSHHTKLPEGRLHRHIGTIDERKKRSQDIFSHLKTLIPREEATIALRYHNPWELLVAVILSAQCTDKKVNEVTMTLFKKYPTLDSYVHANPRIFEQDIFSTGFYRNKTKHILASAGIVHEQFLGEVPRTMKEMLTLPGVSRKTANVVLGNAYGVIDGIAVDTHVRRLARLWRLTNEWDPKKIEQDLMEIISKKDWLHATYYMIEYGRRYCPATKRDHSACPLSTFEH
ncbi:MAG: endonuclease III [Candidatus Yonathbacteria bacterium]|nr:endonuclease III [Candidatus Yonathbacteria bacterium]NTW47884.1 endonuclease III [Candidatus Yonathbacteria bacterium]